MSAALLLGACAGSKKELAAPAPVAAVPVQVDKGPSSAEAFEAAVAPLREKKEQDWASVESEMKGLTEKHPGYAPAWYNLGLAEQRQGKDTEAAKSYRQALAIDGDLVEAKENLAAMAVARGDRAEANLLLEELASHPRISPNTQVVLAKRYLAQGERGRAKSLAEKALGRDPKNMGAYCVLAKAALQKKRVGRARLVAAQGLKLGKSACLHEVQGELAQRGGDTAAALVAYQRAVELDPKLTAARFRLAEISLGYKDFKRAEDNYKAITTYDPKNGPAWINLGVTYKGQGKFEDAEKAYLAASKLEDPEVKEAASYDLGVLYLRHMDRLPEAEAQLKTYTQAGGKRRRSARRMLKEVDQRKKFAAQAERMEAEAKAQAEAEAKRAKEQPPEAAAPAPEPEPTPEVKPAPKKKKTVRRRRRSKPAAPKPAPQPALPPEDDFE